MGDAVPQGSLCAGEVLAPMLFFTSLYSVENGTP